MESSELRRILENIERKLVAIEKLLNEEDDLTQEEMEEYMKLTKKLGDENGAGKSSRIKRIE